MRAPLAAQPAHRAGEPPRPRARRRRAAEPDAVFLDLEDGVPPRRQGRGPRDARRRRASRSDAPSTRRSQVFVRVNGLATPWFDGDVAEALDPGAHRRGGPEGGVGATTSRRRRRRWLAPGSPGPRDPRRRRERAWCGTTPTTCCSAAVSLVLLRRRGLRRRRGWRADGRATSRCSTRGRASRSRLASADVHAVDQIVADFRDDGPLRDATQRRAAPSATGGKLCIHPAQVAARARGVHAGRGRDRPRATIARRVRRCAATRGEATIDFEGEMVDEPMARRARAVIDAAVGP